MKPTPTTPNTLLLGVYVADDRAVILGTLRTAGDEMRTECVCEVGQKWDSIARALACVPVIGCANVVILTTDVTLVQALSRPIQGPKPANVKRYWVAKGEYVNAGWGGDAAHWQVLQQLGMLGGHWAIKQVEDLPKARAMWTQG